jgi:hypothetical protein
MYSCAHEAQQVHATGDTQVKETAMTATTRLEFRQVASPIGTTVTKFGGQPVWLSGPALPLSRRTRKPMTFIGQISIPQSWHGDQALRMAYIFMTGGGFDNAAMETWDPAEGETAVIVQRGTGIAAATPYPDTLRRWNDESGGRREVAAEYAVDETAVDEPPYMSQTETDALSEPDRQRLVEPWRGNKIGGSPYWVQGEQLPYQPWRLLLQLEDGTYPFALNLGTGVGYVFLDAECDEGQLLWQC